MMEKWLVLCSDGDMKWFKELHEARSFMSDLMFIECRCSQLYMRNSDGFYEFKEEL